MKPVEISTRIRIATAEARYWKEILDKKRCASCVHGMSGGCALADYAEPPPEVKASGCDAWEYDEIPF